MASSDIKPDYRKAEPYPQRLTDDRLIRAQLRPSVFGDENDWRRRKPRFSMFGTNRVIEEFVLDIRPSNAEGREHAEGCWVRGGVSYTSEDGDFRQRTEQDVLVFTLTVRPDAFALYAAMITQVAVTDLTFRVSSVQGFYSEWSPAISADHVKVLAAGDAQPLEPKVEGIDPPRLGDIGDVDVNFIRRLVLERKPPAPDEVEGEIAEGPLVETQPQGSALADPTLIKTIRGLKRAVWIVALLLVAILLNLLSR